ARSAATPAGSPRETHRRIAAAGAKPFVRRRLESGAALHESDMALQLGRAAARGRARTGDHRGGNPRGMLALSAGAAGVLMPPALLTSARGDGALSFVEGG